MHTGTLCFLAGVFVFQHLPILPNGWFAALLPVALLGWFRGRRTLAVAACATGFLWALVRAHALFPNALPPAWEGRDLAVEGMVIGIPERAGERTRFEFDLERVVAAGSVQHPAGGGVRRVRVTWYRDAPHLRAGERWRLTLRLKRPRGFANPGNFDYEGWLFRRGVAGTGYVRPGRHERLSSGAWSVARMRQDLSERIDATLGPARLRPLIKALALGVRDEILPGHWRVLRVTGTAHLMAISGLHVGLVSGLAFAVFSFAWRLAGWSVLLIDSARVGAGAAILAAFTYAALAGFSVPTQRALVMVVCLMLAILTRRRLAPATGLGRALLGVLILDPFAVSETGFWLSFCAVAAILFGVSGRLRIGSSVAESVWWRFGRIQVLLGLALLPLGLWFFGEHPLGAPLANAVAVPWVSALVVPPVLAGTLVVAFLPSLGALFLDVGHLALSALWPGLELLARADLTLPESGVGKRWQVLAAMAGALLLAAPTGTPARWLGALWMAPLLLAPPERPPEDTLRVILLDVGQGLSVVLRTRNHTLVYDTGPRFSERFDAGAAVVAPFLRHRGVRAVDALVLSHRHEDHTGGAASLLDRIPVRNIVTNVSPWATGGRPCEAGRRWMWDGARFEVLHPPRGRSDTGNEGSCVLRVTLGMSSVLLTGDMGEPSERKLLGRHVLRSDLMLVPHHGSTTSSTPAFLDAIRPKLALLSAGYRNRFGLPDPGVIARYQARGIEVLSTSTEGAIAVDLHADGTLGRPRRHRREYRRYWHWRGEEAPPGSAFPSIEVWRVILIEMLSGK